MRIDAEGPTDAEVGVGLHDLHGEVVRIDVFLDLSPRDASLNRDLLAFLREADHSIEVPHVQLEGIVRRRLPTHAVAPAADG